MANEVGKIIYVIAGDNSQFQSDVAKTQSVAQGAAGAIQKIFAAISVTAIVAQIGNMVKAAVDAGISFESAFAGVVKTVDATTEELAEMRQGLLDLSEVIPVSADELSGIAEAAGQLGIANKNILSFTEVMANLGVATNMTANDAATSLARMANITGMAQEDFDRLGSTIVALGNNMATTESEIVNMAMRLAGAGSQAGMSEAVIMSLAGALSSLGLEAEAGGSAISKVIVNMKLAAETGASANAIIASTGYTLRELQMLADSDGEAFKALAHSLGMTSGELTEVASKAQSLQDFSDVLGMTAEQFSDFFARDAVGALTAFIEGLGQAEAKGLSAVQVLDNMGITEIRMRDALLRAASAQGVLTSAIEIGTSAWEDNTALTNEASKRYETMESKINILKNTANNLGVSFYGKLRPAIESVVTSATGFVSSLQKIVTGMEDMTVDEASAKIEAFTNAIKYAVVAIGTFAIVSKITMVLSAFNIKMGESVAALLLKAGADSLATVSASALSAGLTAQQIIVSALTGKITLATAAQALWNAVAAANPYVLLALALAAVTVAIVAFADTTRDAALEVKDLQSRIDASRAELDELSASLEQSREAHQKSVAAIEAQYGAADKLIPRLEELANKTNRTAAEDEELAVVVAKLNKLVPDLNLEYDKQTGALNKTTGAVKKYLDAKKDEVLLNEKLERWAKLQEEYAAVQEKYAEAIERESEARRTAERHLADYNNQLAVAKAHTGSLGLQTQTVAKQAQDAWADAKTELGDTASESLTLYTEMEKLNGEMEALAGNSYNTGDALDAAAQAAKELADAAERAGASQTALERIMAATGMSAEEAADEIESLAEITQNAFDKISYRSKISLEEMIENLRYNTDAVANWSSNLRILAERGVDEGLLQVLRDAGPEMALTVAGLVKAADEELEGLNDAFRDSMDGAIQGALDVCNAALPEFHNIGSAMAEGIASGITGAGASAITAASSLARRVVDAMKIKLDIRSPSHVLEREVGEQVPAGIAKGIENMADMPIDALSGVSDRILSTDYGVESTISHLIGSAPAAATPSFNITLRGDVLMDGFKVGHVVLENLDDVAAHTIGG